MTIPSALPTSLAHDDAMGACGGTTRPVGEAPSPLARLVEELRAHVTRHARDRREAGLPLHRVLAEVRCLLREAESCESWQDPSASALLLSQVTRWSVDAYHHHDPSHDAEPPNGADRS